MQNEADRNDLLSIDRITLEIGQFSGVNIDALNFAFEVLSPGTVLEKTSFEYTSPPLLLYCRECENAYAGDFEDTRCPVCLQTNFDILQGQEMKILTIEGQTKDEKSP